MVTAGTACMARPAGLRLLRSRRSRRRRWARAHHGDVTSGYGCSGQDRHGGHGRHGPCAITATAVGPCPPYERDNREGSRRSRPARRSREARTPWPSCGATWTGPSKMIPAITTITAITPVTAVTARSRRERSVHAGSRRSGRDLAIAEAPGGTRTPRSDPGSGPPSERNRLRPAGGAPTTPPSHLRPRGRNHQREPGRQGARESGSARRGYTWLTIVTTTPPAQPR
jgi:hypothetical protein